MSTRAESPVAALLREHGLADAPEEPFPNDGWSGATLTRLVDAAGRAFILKRSSFERDWIARATHDTLMRETRVAESSALLPLPARYPALGAAVDEAETAILMPDLSAVLFDWGDTLFHFAFDERRQCHLVTAQ